MPWANSIHSTLSHPSSARSQRIGRSSRLGVLLLVLCCGLLLASTAVASAPDEPLVDEAGINADVRAYSATISPTSVTAGDTTTYVITISNLASSTKSIGSATIAIPGNVASASLNSVTGPGSKSWTGSIIAGTAFVKSAGAGNDVAPGESVVVTIVATASCTTGSSVWTTGAVQDRVFSGLLGRFTLSGAQPSVTIGGVCPVTEYTATISPDTTVSDQGDYGFTVEIKNRSESNRSFGSVTIAAPLAFLDIDIKSARTSSDKDWDISYNIFDRLIKAHVNVAGDEVAPGGSVFVHFHASTPMTCSAFTWKTTVYQGNYFGNPQFSIYGAQPVVTITCETTPPQSTITLLPGTPNGDNGWYTDPVAVFVTASDNGSGVSWIRCAVDPATAPASYDDLPLTCGFAGLLGDIVWSDGQHVVYAAGIDFKGNKEVPLSRSFKIDRTPPTGVNVNADRSTDSNGYYNHSFTATWTGADATSGIASCTVTPYSNPDTNSGVLSGSCTDNAGNNNRGDGPDLARDVVTFDFKYDATAPVVTIEAERAADNNGWYNHAVLLTVKGSDDTSGVASCQADVTYSTPDSATASVTRTCADVAGNTGSKTFDIKFDVSAPDTSISGAPDAVSNKTQTTFTFSGNDSVSGVSSYECQLDGNAWNVCTSPQSYTGLTEGNHTFAVRATNGAGLTDSTPATHAWMIDLTMPVTVWETHPPTILSSDAALAVAQGPSITFKFHGVDLASHGVTSGINHFECLFDRGSFFDCASPYTITDLKPGYHAFQVRAIDNAGNVDDTPAGHNWLVTPRATPTATPTPIVPPATGCAEIMLRIDAGGQGSATGWLADQQYLPMTTTWGFLGGMTYATNAAVSGASEQRVYQTERWWPAPGGYRVEVAPGDYKVTFHLAEIYPWATRGTRRFSVLMEGQKVISDLDIFALAGLNKALVLERSIHVDDGLLNVDVVSAVGSAAINGIEIYRIIPCEPAPAP